MELEKFAARCSLQSLSATKEESGRADFLNVSRESNFSDVSSASVESQCRLRNFLSARTTVPRRVTTPRKTRDETVSDF